MVKISRISLAIVSSIPGRTTFTTTWSPSSVVAAWTCANDADARGSRSKVANFSPMLPPRASSMSLTATALSNGATRSCNLANSSA